MKILFKASKQKNPLGKMPVYYPISPFSSDAKATIMTSVQKDYQEVQHVKRLKGEPATPLLQMALSPPFTHPRVTLRGKLYGS